MNVHELLRDITHAQLYDNVRVIVDGKEYDINYIHIDNGFVEIVCKEDNK